MIRSSAVVAAIFCLTIFAAHAEGARQLSCTGLMIEPKAISQSPKTLRLSIGPGRKVAIDLGQGNSSARFVSDNNIQLKFSTKDFVGEFFHYTNELFLIYKSGHLARLTCSKG